MEPHAVVSTGKSAPLAGGRSRRTANGVPILELSNKHYEMVAESAERFHDESQDTEYFVGKYVYMHAPVARTNGGASDIAILEVGGSHLDAAAKECITYFEDVVSDGPPDWVASTHDDLAAVLA